MLNSPNLYSLNFQHLRTVEVLRHCVGFMPNEISLFCESCLIIFMLSAVIRAIHASDEDILTNTSWLPLEFTAHMEWQTYNSHLCSIHIGQQQLCSLLGPSFLSHNYTLTPTQLKRALTYIGPNHRLRRVVRDMITGKVQVRVGVIGTSVSWGTGRCNERLHTRLHNWGEMNVCMCI